MKMDIRMLRQKTLQALKRSNVAILFFILILFSSFFRKPQLEKIKIYLVNWEAKYTLIRTVDNFKSNYLFYFESKDSDLFDMFSDYQDCVVKLKSQDTLAGNISTSCTAYAELVFGHNIVKVFFKSTGEYFFEGKWYKVNSGFYYLLFNVFSNELVKNETLIKAKANMKDNFWHNE